MRLKTLRFFEFRNLRNAQIELAPGINFFLGDNAQGKTNVLEALYLLGRGTSFRPTEPGSFLRTGAGNETGSEDRAPRAKITGHFALKDFDETVELILEPTKRFISVNGKRANATDLARFVPLVLFSPESLSAIKEGPEQRRQLADDLVLTQAPRQAHLLAQHGRCLRARNRVLRELAKGDGDVEGLERTLMSLNSLYFLLCTHVTDARTDALRTILPGFREAMAFISGIDHGDISVDYLISGESAIEWRESEIYDALCKRHRELAAQEIAAGASLVGPHKHDVRFLFHGKDSRFYCSQGQQRALILSFKIAQIVYHQTVHQTYPMLLLDDVMSELDEKKRLGLMRFFEGTSAQILMTSTEASCPVASGRNSFFSVVAGEVAGLDQPR